MSEAQQQSSVTYWLFGWAKNWASRTPWSLDEEPMPYVGWRVSHCSHFRLFVLGPLALARIDLGTKIEDTNFSMEAESAGDST